MSEIAVTNTGPPFHLAQIQQEKQLTLFEKVAMSEQIKEELSRHGVFDRVSTELGSCLVVESVSQSELDAQREAMSGFKLHQADLSVAALAARLTPDVVLTDDLELRKSLESIGRVVVGSVGILVRAFNSRRLTKSELQTNLDHLFDDSTLYLSKGFRIYVRKLLDSLSE